MSIGSFICKIFGRFNEGISEEEMIEDSSEYEEYREDFHKEAEMIALQSQINPHFLYNTLDSIRSEALINDQDEIADMVEALSSFFRYIISQKGELVTLREEIQSIENYFKIQKYRFGDKIDLKIEWGDNYEDIKNYAIPKLVLQPIVENAIYHGLEPKRGHGLVTVSMDMTRAYLIIVISDDGVGMTIEALKRIRQFISLDSLKATGKHKKRGSLALRNVNQRIQLNYGANYGLNLKSMPEMGAEVEITLPLIKTGDLDEG